MKLIEDLSKIKKSFKNTVITIGNFDGVHIGHQALLHEVIEKADAIDGTAMAMTFDPHPIRVLKPNGHPPLITLSEQKVELIGNSGIDVLVCVPFTKEFAAISARGFVGDILVGLLGIKAVVVGADYTFGRGREGDLDFLKSLAERLGFEVVVADWIQGNKKSSERISSTRIRELVTEGRMQAAHKMLGRHYQIRGTVARGRDRGGRLLGCPTANIKLYDELSPKSGVYAVTVECMDGKYMGVANIGFSPTFDDHIFTVEVHLLDFDRDIYGERIRVNFIERIRDEVKFDTIDALSEQIEKDIVLGREILAHLM
jgi:riboflavin kinase / FMN adenylyltransferase